MFNNINYEDAKNKLFKKRTKRWKSSNYSTFDLKSEFKRSINENIHEISANY